MPSTVYMLWFQQTSPLLQRRDRRASSSSRDCSANRDGSHRSTSPHARIKVKGLLYWGSILADSGTFFGIDVLHV
jgi:hypothetical protein